MVERMKRYQKVLDLTLLLKHIIEQLRIAEEEVTKYLKDYDTARRIEEARRELSIAKSRLENTARQYEWLNEEVTCSG